MGRGVEGGQSFREIRGRIPAGSRVIVEIGCSFNPFFINLRERRLRQSLRGAVYIGIDILKDELRHAADYARRFPDQKAFFVPADDPELRTLTDFADQVVLCNVLGDRDTTDRNALLDQIHRMVKPGGKVTVVETYSPSRYPLGRLKGQMLTRFFQQSNEGSEKNIDHVGQYVYTTAYAPEYYIAEFTKARPARRVR